MMNDDYNADDDTGDYVAVPVTSKYRASKCCCTQQRRMHRLKKVSE